MPGRGRICLVVARMVNCTIGGKLILTILLRILYKRARSYSARRCCRGIHLSR